MLRRLLLVLVSVLAFQAASHAASITFAQPVHLRFTGTSNGVAVADFNGDGRDDLAVAVQISEASQTRGYLKVLLQGEDGSMGPALTLQVPSVAHVVNVGQLRPSGASDILVGHQQGLAVYRWDGIGGFVLDNHPGAYSCTTMAAADLDADGATDALCLGAEADAMLFYGDPATGFEPPRYMQTAAWNAGSGRLKDITGDGRLDLLLASSAANSFFVYPNDGARGFLPAVAYTYPENYLWSSAIEAMDVDHDGANEAFVAAPCNVPCATLYTYRQGVHGYLELSESVPTLDNPGAFLATDVNGDGRQDLLIGHSGWDTLGRFMGQAQHLSSSELWSSVPMQGGSHRLAAGDLNHDGQADVAVANSFGVSVLYGGRQVPSDFDGDFASDLFWRSGTGENVVWKSANSATPITLSHQDTSWSIQAIDNFDGDGLADVFWRNRTTGANEIWLQGSQVEQAASVASQDWQVVGAGDFDGDGRSDLLWRNSVSGANAIWKSGNSTTPQAVMGVTDVRWKVAGVADFDGDGQSDILWRHSTSGSNGIWRSGRHDLPQVVTAIPSVQWTVAGVGDFNGDHKDDVAWRNISTGANGIWLSANSATPMTVTSVPNLAWAIVAVGDYNKDGRADLMWRNNSSGANVIWRSADSQQTQAVTAISGWSVVR